MIVGGHFQGGALNGAFDKIKKRREFFSIVIEPTPARKSHHVSLSLRTNLLRIRSGFFLLCLLIGSAFAGDEGEFLKNGEFIDSWKVRDSHADQALPKGWFASAVETSGNPWVKVLEGTEYGVEIRAGSEPRYLFQDVKIDAKGEGAATVTVMPRDAEDNFSPAVSKDLLLSDSFQEEELSILMPEDVAIIRIMIGPKLPDSVAVFEKLELISPSGGNE
jgi:hypothetical protein